MHNIIINVCQDYLIVIASFCSGLIALRKLVSFFVVNAVSCAKFHQTVQQSSDKVKKICHQTAYDPRNVCSIHPFGTFLH